MDVHEHRVLTALLSRERLGFTTLYVSVSEREGYSGQINDLEARGILSKFSNGTGIMCKLTPAGRAIAESLPEKWESAE